MAETPPTWKYRAFISYSHADEEWARWLHKSLETYKVPKRLVGTETEFGPVPERIAPVFRDRDELATATSLGEILFGSIRAPPQVGVGDKHQQGRGCDGRNDAHDQAGYGEAGTAEAALRTADLHEGGNTATDATESGEDEEPKHAEDEAQDGQCTDGF